MKRLVVIALLRCLATLSAAAEPVETLDDAVQWNLALDPHHGPTLRQDSLAIGLVTVDTAAWKGVKTASRQILLRHPQGGSITGSLRPQGTTQLRSDRRAG